jgi:hypothetical protein
MSEQVGPRRMDATKHFRVSSRMIEICDPDLVCNIHQNEQDLFSIVECTTCYQWHSNIVMEEKRQNEEVAETRQETTINTRKIQ